MYHLNLVLKLLWNKGSQYKQLQKGVNAELCFCEQVKEYIFVWASKSMLPFHLHLSPQTLSFLQKHFSSQKGMYSERSGCLWVRILPHLPSVWVTPIWYRNLIVVAPPSLSKSMFCRRMWQKNGSFLSYPQIHSYMHVLLQCTVDFSKCRFGLHFCNFCDVSLVKLEST